MGALGSQIQEYLRRYPTTFAAYEKGISTWSTPFSVAFEDWYLPAMVEELSDWTYQEDILCTRLNGSPHPKLWAQLLPYAFGMMQPLSLESALRWENAIANFSNDIKTAFYARIEGDAGHQLAQMELERPLHEQGYWERLALALPHMHGRLLSREEQACFWERVWRFLTQRTWTHSNGMHAARIGALWAQYVPLDCVEDYLRRATLLLQHPIVQWDAALLDLVVCRARNEDEDGAMLLRMWLEVDAHARGTLGHQGLIVPWHYILPKWTHWNVDALMDVIGGEATHQLALQYLVLRDSNYRLSLKKAVLLHQCEHDTVQVDTLEMVSAIPELHYMVHLWTLLRADSVDLSRECIRTFQTVFGCHPLYERDALGARVPGWSALHRIFVSMDITYVPALRYIEQAMGAEREVYATIRGEQLGDILEGS